MDLITNVTQAVIAMETQAQRLDEELQRMRQKTRQLLWKRRKDVLWTAIHRCVFFNGYSKQNFVPLKTQNGANKILSQDTKRNSTHELNHINELTVKGQ
jgi:lipoate-protein ligase B